jgi:hypothetical protein
VRVGGRARAARQRHKAPAVALGRQLHDDHALGIGLLGFGHRLAQLEGEVHRLVFQKKLMQRIIQHNGREQIAHFVLKISFYPVALVFG